MSSRKCILVMDDDPSACDHLAHQIKFFGFGVECVNSREDALTRLGEKSFDAVLLDQWVKDGCSEEILKWLKDQGRPDPVVMMSSMADYDVWIDLMNKGAADLIAKPVEAAQLKRALQMAMGSILFTESERQSAKGS